jgi:hypothetical protein
MFMSSRAGTAGCACWHSLLVHFLLFAGLEEADDICDVIRSVARDDKVFSSTNDAGLRADPSLRSGFEGWRRHQRYFW